MSRRRSVRPMTVAELQRRAAARSAEKAAADAARAEADATCVAASAAVTPMVDALAALSGISVHQALSQLMASYMEGHRGQALEADALARADRLATNIASEAARSAEYAERVRRLDAAAATSEAIAQREAVYAQARESQDLHNAGADWIAAQSREDGKAANGMVF